MKSNKSEIRRNTERLVRNAIRRGELVRQNSCARCGTSCKTQGHHADYSRPLDVEWLCKKCHTAVHYPGRPFKPESRTAYYATYHEAHREERRLYMRAYNRSRVDKSAAAAREARKRDPEKFREWWKAWIDGHRSERASYMKEYAKEHRAEINAKRRERRNAAKSKD